MTAVCTSVAGTDEAVGVARTTATWHVLHTRSRMEKALAQSLAAMGIEHYLPLVTEYRTYGRRRIGFDKPLFAGYVFLHGSREQAFDADRTRRVAQIIEVADQARFEHELAQIRHALEAQGQRQFDPYPMLRAGVRVAVVSGPLAGLEGVVESRHKLDRVVLQVTTLGRAVSVETDGAAVVVLD